MSKVRLTVTIDTEIRERLECFGKENHMNLSQAITQLILKANVHIEPKAKPRTIQVKLSDKEYDRLAETVGNTDLSINEIVEGFLNDLINSESSNGDKERYKT